MQLAQHARRVRITQLFLLIAGVCGALVLPLSMLNDLMGYIWLGSVASVLMVPFAYFYFARSVQSAVQASTGTKGSQYHWLALATIVPLLGTIFEVIVLQGLAREAARIEGAEDRSSPVLVLALVRIVAGWILGPIFAAFFVAVADGLATYTLVYAIGPLISFGLLGFITQMIAMPIFDDAMAPVDVKLSAAGAGGSAAVSSTHRS